jgi:MFS family permease
VVLAGVAFGTFYTPGMTLLANLSEEIGLDYGYAFALINLAWAPGFAIGAAGGASLAGATTDAVPYLVLSALCAATLLATRRRPPPC